MFSRSSKLIDKAEKNRGSDKDMIRKVTDDVLKRALGEPMSREEWEDFALGLHSEKPDMASVFNLSNRILLSLDDENPEESIARLAKDILERKDPFSTIALRFTERHSFRRVMVNSYSSTVLSVLKELDKNGDIQVIVAESLPMGEGALFAEALVSAGIRTEIIPDTMVFECMDRTDAYICGTDLVSPDGVFNKIGSRAMAAAARMSGKKVLVVCDSLKLCPRSIKSFDQVREPAGKGIHRTIQMFEMFPISLVDEVITECGSFTEEDLKPLFRDWVVDPRL